MGTHYKDKAWWQCVCECGNSVIVRGSSLRNKTTRSCGCLRSQKRPERSGRNNPNWKGGPPICIGCGQRIQGTDRTRKRCRVCYVNHSKGSNHPHWNPELTKNDRERGRFFEGIHEWAKQVKIRDNYTCQICKQVGYDLISHHVLPYAKYPKLRTDIDNGVTLCNKCHRGFHSAYGFNCNARQLLEFTNSFKEYYLERNA